jgi:ligand-binding sensor domain-containing protein
LVWLLSPRDASAERLPIRIYTAEDGLAGDQVNAVMQDSRGFIWVATDTGVSRFDGARFISYDEAEGLPAGKVTSIAETADGGVGWRPQRE